MRITMASDVDPDGRPNALARGLILTASTIIGMQNIYRPDWFDKKRAMWRLLDAIILLAESIGETEVTSGLASATGWRLEKTNAPRPSRRRRR